MEQPAALQVDLETGEITPIEPKGLTEDEKKSFWAHLGVALAKVKAFFKDKWKSMGLMVIVALALDLITGFAGGALAVWTLV